MYMKRFMEQKLNPQNTCGSQFYAGTDSSQKGPSSVVETSITLSEVALRIFVFLMYKLPEHKSPQHLSNTVMQSKQYINCSWLSEE